MTFAYINSNMPIAVIANPKPTLFSPRDRVTYLVKDYVEQCTKKSFSLKLHLERVAICSAKIARRLKLSEKDIRAAEIAGALHDIGKLHLPMDLLEKPASLSPGELQTIQEIPHYSAGIAHLLGLSFKIQKGIVQRHERLDGFGYPHRLPEGKINLIAKIVAVADSYDSLTHHQSYRLALSPCEAIGEIRGCCNSRYDPVIVDALTLLVLGNP